LIKLILEKIDFIKSHEEHRHFLNEIVRFFVYNMISLVILHIKVLR